MTNPAILKASKDNIIVDLSHRGLLKVNGEDAINFLQGQVTNDIKQLDNNVGQFTGYCSPKGRLLALFYAFKHQGDIFLTLDAESLESIAKRLRMFVLRSKVVIEDASSTIRLGIAGDDAEAQLKTVFSSIPTAPHETTTDNDTTIIRLPFTQPAFEIITNQVTAEKLKEKLGNDFSLVDSAAWDWLETQSAVPKIGLDTKDAFVPQMINLDALGGINFKKGCYTGQEIVARTHYLGKVKRRTMLANVQAKQAPAPGSVVLDANGQNVGQIVRAVEALESGFDILFEARLESIEAGKLQCNDSQLTLKTMPYSLVLEG